MRRIWWLPSRARDTTPGWIATAAGTSQGETDDRTEKKEAERRELTRDFTIAAVLTVPVFILEMGSHVIPGMHDLIASTIGMQTNWYIQFVLTTIVLSVPGIRFYDKGLPALWRLAPDMNSLVAGRTLAAYGYSLVATFAPGFLPAGTVNVYFEAAAVIVTLILLGRLLEARAKGRTSEAIKRLVAFRPRWRACAGTARRSNCRSTPCCRETSSRFVPAIASRWMARSSKARAMSTKR
jgi:Au+-exporting ATPase